MSKNKKKFINPYYFVSLPDKKTTVEEEGGERLTGKITYEVVTKSPIFIPNTSSNAAFSKTDEYANQVAEKIEEEAEKIEEKEGKEAADKYRKNKYAEDDKHISQDFYSYAELDEKKRYDNESPAPILSGSEIRGMMRSVYEAITGSCMSIINDEMVITNRMNTNEVFVPGLLKREDDEIYLVPADVTYMWKGDMRNFGRCYDGKKLKFYTKSVKGKQYVDVKPPRKGEDKEKNYGYLLIGELPRKGKKKNVALFKPNEEAGFVVNAKAEDEKEKYLMNEAKEGEEAEKITKILFDKNLKKKMQDVLDAYENDSATYKNYARCYHDFIEGKNRDGEKYFPIYMKVIRVVEDKRANAEDNEEVKYIVHVSPAAITKKSYVNRVRELAGEKFQPCTTSELCPACDLFGMVNANGNSANDENTIGAKASRLRFADARLAEGMNVSNIYGEIITIPELAGAKISNAQMYLKSPDTKAADWNYDYWLDIRGNAHLYDAELNGRKFYWHHPELIKNSDAKLPTQDPSKRNSTIRPLKKDTVFVGEIYFEKITEKQLEQLVYLCDISRDGTMGYKIGKGKPLGMGSIAMTISKIDIRKIDLSKPEIYYEEPIDFNNEEERKEYKPSHNREGVFVESAKKEMEFMLGFDSVEGATISYPYTTDYTLILERGVDYSKIIDVVAEATGMKDKDKVEKSLSRGKMNISYTAKEILEKKNLQGVSFEPVTEGFRWYVTNKKLKIGKKYLIGKGPRKGLPYLEVINDSDPKGN